MTDTRTNSTVRWFALALLAALLVLGVAAITMGGTGDSSDIEPPF